MDPSHSTSARPGRSIAGDAAIRILSTAVVLFALMLPIRGRIMGYGYDDEWLRRPFFVWSRVILGGCYDGLYVALWVALFLGLVMVFGRRPAAQRWLWPGFLAVACLSLFAALVNMQFAYLLGTPFNYQWLYYSDFLQSVDSHQAMLHEITWVTGALFVAACAAIVALSLWLARAIRWALSRTVSPRAVWIPVLAGACLYSAMGFWWTEHVVARHDWRRGQFENAVFAFTGSVLTHRQKPGLFTMSSNMLVDELVSAGERPADVVIHPWGTNSAVSNVIFFVLESVPAHYAEPFGGKYPVTPTLARYQDRAALFTRIYAHAPNTITTLFSLESSMYPWVSYRFISSDQSAIAVPTLSSELKRRGYRTGFFNSADNRFQNIGTFMALHGVDHIEDWRDRRCPQPPIKGSSEGWPFLDGSDDGCTVDSLIRWIDAKPGESFFATLWTIMTHHPYFPGAKEENFGVTDKDFNRYLNGLRVSDEALGKLLRHLEKRGLLETTLVVVLGDHGEAFGEHGKRTHATALYDENVHVPLMFINPSLFHGEKSATLGGIVDVPATVLNLLGHALPAPWQGRSLFSANRPSRVFFFSPWSDYWFGYREGDTTFLYNASIDNAELYDMADDPLQKTNLAPRRAESIPARLQLISAWIQRQNAIIQRLSAASQQDPVGVQ